MYEVIIPDRIEKSSPAFSAPPMIECYKLCEISVRTLVRPVAPE